MKLSETIANLRREHNMTQEAIADALGVSIAAVSKWENAIACPDIELLPKIAALFDVSIDYLMDYSRTAEKTIDEHVSHAYTLVKKRDNRAADEHMSSLLIRYPENNRVKIECARIKQIRTCGDSELPKNRVLLADAERILKSVNLRELNRHETELYYSTLASVYTVWKRFDDAAAALDAIMPNGKFEPEQHKYYLELERGNRDGAITGMQKMMLRSIHNIIVTSSWYYAAYPDQPEKVLEHQQFLVRLLEAFTCGMPSPFDRDLAYTWECITLMHTKLNRNDEAIDAFRRAVECAERFDGITEMTYTVLPALSMLDPVFDAEMDYYPHGHGSLASLIAHIVAEAGPEREEYAKIREDERVRKITSCYC